MPKYHPPPLKTRVLIRNPNMRPKAPKLRYGQPDPDHLEGDLIWPGDTKLKWPGGVEIDWPGLGILTAWGKKVKAHRRDRAPEVRFDAGETIYVQHVVWTVRYRKDIDADTEIVHDGKVYRAIGPPVVRGGKGFGRLRRYHEITTELRQ